MSNWPTTLPNPSASGYGLKPVDAVARTQMEGGAARARRRSKARNDKVSANWEMTDEQLAVFRAWFDSDAGAAGGAAWFTVNLAVGTGGVVPAEARFAGDYSVTSDGPINWVVSAELELR